MTPPASYKERIQIHTLKDIGWHPERIAEHLDLSLRQVDYLSNQPATPKKRRGRPPVITTPKRKELVSFVTRNAENRRISFEDLLRTLNWPVSASAIKTALQMEGLNRRVARLKPFLSDKTRENRLLWARGYTHWNEFNWRTILWTDESAMNVTGQQRGWVTRWAGEEYLMDCIVSKFKKLGGCMVWGAISGRYGLGKYYFSYFLMTFELIFRSPYYLGPELGENHIQDVLRACRAGARRLSQGPPRLALHSRQRSSPLLQAHPRGACDARHFSSGLAS
jgi:transposase